MNKFGSKYFNTSLRLDEALIALLEQKDLEYIMVKEICHQAGVNRSTFYLHYETIADLVEEALEMINRRFLSYFPQQKDNVLGDLGSQNREELVPVTREYLLPYLRFIRTIKRSTGRPFGIRVAWVPTHATENRSSTALVLFWSGSASLLRTTPITWPTTSRASPPSSRSGCGRTVATRCR